VTVKPVIVECLEIFRKKEESNVATSNLFGVPYCRVGLIQGDLVFAFIPTLTRIW
jgi:hypothetical protein